MNKLVIKTISDQETWDSFVNQSQTSTLMHYWTFLKTIEKYSKYKFLPYGFYEENELICIIPLFLKRILFIKLLFSPPPMMGLPYLGFVFKNEFFSLRADEKESFLKTVFKNFDKVIKQINPVYLFITSTPYLTDFRIFKWNNYILDIKHTYILDLSKPKIEILKDMKNKRRQKINKAKREKIEIHEINSPDVLFKAIKEKYGRQNMNNPIISEEYLKEIKRAFPHNILFRVAEHDGQIVGSEALINYKDLHLNWLGGGKPHQARSLPINEFLIWDYIEKAKEKHIKKFDFVGANTEYISFFKAQFGPELTPYFTIIKKNIIGRSLEKIYLTFIKKSIF